MASDRSHVIVPSSDGESDAGPENNSRSAVSVSEAENMDLSLDGAPAIGSLGPRGGAVSPAIDMDDDKTESGSTPEQKGSRRIYGPQPQGADDGKEGSGGSDYKYSVPLEELKEFEAKHAGE
jgi:hypothetical protein